jgi:nucleoside-diphosphate-sugar epimerase
MDALVERNPSVRKVVVISSLAAAGPSVDGRAVTEADEPHPITTYGRSKLAAERAALGYADRFHVIALRPPGIYGPGDREIFTFFETVNKGIKPLIGDPERKIQLVHVDDLCRAAVLAIEGATTSGEAYFTAEKRAYTMIELVAALAEAGEKKGVWLKLPGSIFKVIAFFSEFTLRAVNATPMLTREKAGELLASWEISVEKAKKEFGFESRIDFARGAKETFDWYRREGWLT